MSKIFEALKRAERQAAEAAPRTEPAGPLTRAWAKAAAALEAAMAARTTMPQESLQPEGAAAATPSLWSPPASSVSFLPGSKAVVAEDPASLASDQYRVLRTNLLKLSQAQTLKVVLIASPGPGDGKTLTALNLALTFCQKQDTRVLLVEGDLRKPAISSLMKLEPGRGLSDYLSEEAALEEIIRPTCVPRFHLLASGRMVNNPTDLLHSPRLATLMETARHHFDWVVLDGPPTNPVADYELLAAHSDGILLVVRPFHTSRDLLRLTTESLQDKKVLGVVLNASTSFQRYGGYYGYGYGYGYGRAVKSNNGRMRHRVERQEAEKRHEPGLNPGEPNEVLSKTSRDTPCI